MTVALIAFGACFANKRETDRQQVGEADAVEEMKGDRPGEADFLPGPWLAAAM